jgi:hypothetical protein
MPGLNNTTASAIASPNATHGETQRNQPGILNILAASV